MKDFFLNNYTIITYSVEFIAAISGTIYLSRTKNELYRIFVQYLWLTFTVEVIGLYKRGLQYNYDYEWFIAIKNSVFCDNHWLYNIYSYLAIGIIGVFYSGIISSRLSKIVIRTILILYSLFVLIYFLTTDAFFFKELPYDMLISTVIICIYVILYFIELMKSDSLLDFYKLPSFYISIGLMLWYICVMPLIIYDEYFLAINTDFLIFRYLLLLFLNIFTYLCFTFGFWYSLYKKKP